MKRRHILWMTFLGDFVKQVTESIESVMIEKSIQQFVKYKILEIQQFVKSLSKENLVHDTLRLIMTLCHR